MKKYIVAVFILFFYNSSIPKEEYKVELLYDTELLYYSILVYDFCTEKYVYKYEEIFINGEVIGKPISYLGFMTFPFYCENFNYAPSTVVDNSVEHHLMNNKKVERNLLRDNTLSLMGSNPQVYLMKGNTTSPYYTIVNAYNVRGNFAVVEDVCQGYLDEYKLFLPFVVEYGYNEIYPLTEEQVKLKGFIKISADSIDLKIQD